MKVAIVGVGSIGGVFASSIISHGIVDPHDLILIERNENTCEELRKKIGCYASSEITKVVSEASVVVLAIKPQDFSEVAPELRKVVHSEQIVLSMMTGIRIEKLARTLNTSKIVRCMPNLPFTVGRGLSACYEEGGLTDDERNFIRKVLSATGRSIFVTNEDLIDAVTALSASGPGYIAYLMGFFEQAAIQLGFDSDTARKLTAHTLEGTAALLVEGELSTHDIIRRVASPAGTTRAAISYLEEHSIGEQLKEAIFRAEKRAKELGK